MKIPLFLSLVGVAAIFTGCATYRGGADEPTGTMRQTEPVYSDPSLPQDPNAGPTVVPP